MTVSRRLLLRTSAGLGSALVVGSGALAVPAAAAAAEPLSEAHRAMVLRVAKAGASFPVAMADFGEQGPATARATAPRLAAVLARVDAPRIDQVRSAAQRLVDRQVPAGDSAVLAAIAAVAGQPDNEKPLAALVAVAAATVCRVVDPAADEVAELWIGVVRQAYAGKAGKAD